MLKLVSPNCFFGNSNNQVQRLFNGCVSVGVCVCVFCCNNESVVASRARAGAHVSCLRQGAVLIEHIVNGGGLHTCGICVANTCPHY